MLVAMENLGPVVLKNLFDSGYIACSHRSQPGIGGISAVDLLDLTRYITKARNEFNNL